ncbi:ABC transporter permease [Mycoplana dimorpha]|uniref:Putative spermidine/putrescine transport system permease protein n=1 Tax=Mycoplana dimorpha TaxID=28320 RepID=A0A2T5AQY4_MYCDI|nr:ABC transporter permease [Mycoplana dimorpha]PTM89154.1 putative spermidine/putrescine transport system permease protein [Mycoplana dimorpha]
MSRLIYWVSVTFCASFLILPLVVVWPLAFNPSSFLTYPMEGFTFDWFAKVLSDPGWTRPMLNSVRVALGVTVLAVVIGGLAALGVMMTRRGTQIVLSALFVSPLVVPSVVVAVALAYAFGRTGVGGGYLSLVLAHSIVAAPLVFLSVMTSLRGLDPNLDLAGASLGASRIYRFFTVTLPLTAPGFAAGAVFAFITSFDEVVLALFLADPGSSTLPIALFAGLRDRLEPPIVVVAVLLSVLSVLFLMLLNYLQKRHAAPRS